MTGVVVVGAGQAAFQLAASLRQGGYARPITLVGDEPGLPYGRPPLSKAYLLGEADVAALELRPTAFYAERGLTVLSGERVEAIDRSARRVSLRSGGALAYDHLVLATGSRNRPLPAPGAGLVGVHRLRTLADADALKSTFEQTRSVVIVGAGFVGLEFAAVCAAKGVPATVLESADRPLARSVSPAMASAIVAAQAAAGVRFAFGAVVAAIMGEGRAAGVATGDGRLYPADLVLVAIGASANHELAEAAGLAVSNGIDVDAFLSTSDPAISAIGDCANHPSPYADGLRVRIESVQNAVDGARCVAARLNGDAAPHAAAPWFWSDQGPLKLQIAGLGVPHERTILRGDPASGAFSAFCYRGGRLAGVESLNRPSDHMSARRLIQAGVSPTEAQAADPGFDLKAFAMRMAGQGGADVPGRAKVLELAV